MSKPSRPLFAGLGLLKTCFQFCRRIIANSRAISNCVQRTRDPCYSAKRVSAELGATEATRLHRTISGTISVLQQARVSQRRELDCLLAASCFPDVKSIRGRARTQAGSVVSDEQELGVSGLFLGA